MYCSEKHPGITGALGPHLGLFYLLQAPGSLWRRRDFRETRISPCFSVPGSLQGWCLPCSSQAPFQLREPQPPAGGVKSGRNQAPAPPSWTGMQGMGPGLENPGKMCGARNGLDCTSQRLAPTGYSVCMHACVRIHVCVHLCSEEVSGASFMSSMGKKSDAGLGKKP